MTSFVDFWSQVRALMAGGTPIGLAKSEYISKIFTFTSLILIPLKSATCFGTMARKVARKSPKTKIFQIGQKICSGICLDHPKCPKPSSNSENSSHADTVKKNLHLMRGHSLALVSAGPGSILESFWSKLEEKVICWSDDVSCFNHVSEKEGCAPPPPVYLV